MAKSKDDIKYGTSQARLNEDEAVRIAYKHGTPLEGGKIAESEPVDLFPAAHNISKSSHAPNEDLDNNQSQMQRHIPHSSTEGAPETTTNSASFPKKTPPLLNTK